MRLLDSITLALTLLTPLLEARGSNSEAAQYITCSGAHASCGEATQSPTTITKQDGDVKAKVTPTKRKRSVLDLFHNGSPSIFIKRAALPDLLAGKAPITVDQVISMITNNQALPPPLQGPAASFAQSLGLKMPDPKTQKPTPPDLADHPCSLALERLKAGNFDPKIIAAAKAAWGGGNGKGAADKGGKVNAAAQLKDPGKLKARDGYQSSGIYGRDAYWDDENGLYAREAEVGAAAYFEDIMERDEGYPEILDALATREAGFDDEDVSLDVYVRDVEDLFDESGVDYGF